jgi:hypothetical protein
MCVVGTKFSWPRNACLSRGRDHDSMAAEIHRRSTPGIKSKLRREILSRASNRESSRDPPSRRKAREGLGFGFLNPTRRPGRAYWGGLNRCSRMCPIVRNYIGTCHLSRAVESAGSKPDSRWHAECRRGSPSLPSYPRNREGCRRKGEVVDRNHGIGRECATTSGSEGDEDGASCTSM